MIKAGIIGSTGYAGQEIVRILLGHKDVEIVWYGSRSFIDKKYYEVFGNMFQIVDATCLGENMDELAEKVDVIFTATPQGLCSSLVNEDILSKVKIIDLSADFRIKDVATYEKWYKIEHKSPEFIDEAVYGLCEINRDKVKGCRLLANPGCYTTCSILSLYPLVKEKLIDPNTIIVDAKSGTSGAGRGAKIPNLFCEVNESIKAYGVTTHRHTPEIEEQLGYAYGSPIMINFTPHLVPMNRGILVTAYASLKEKVDYDTVRAAYDKYYANERFVRVLDKDVCPETRWVEGSNYVDVNFKIDERTGRIIAMGALDNLVKGSMGRHWRPFVNYIGTIMVFIFFANTSGLFGLRPPTADYGTTLALALITFVLIQYSAFKTSKLHVFTDLFKPIPILFPINLIGEFATPLSMSLRLFGNIMAGTIMMALWYGLLPWLAQLGIPAFLHMYFDLFSGAIQTFVFAMLTMTFITDKREA